MKRQHNVLSLFYLVWFKLEVSKQTCVGVGGSHLPVRSVLLLRRGVHRTPAPSTTRKNKSTSPWKNRMKCYKYNIPRFHPYCKTKEVFCHLNNFNAVNTIGLISKTVFTNARKWSQDSKLISHTNRNLSENSHYPSFFLNALKYRIYFILILM